MALPNEVLGILSFPSMNKENISHVLEGFSHMVRSDGYRE